jgi:hypothetical protein
MLLESINWMDFIGLFIMLFGFIVGLGAVIVIDIHGFLGRKSSYWTEATIRTHKITKPLIWVGIFSVVIGGIIFYRNVDFVGIPLIHSVIALVLIINGLFLSFKVSPFLLNREKEGKAKELLPKSLQNKIVISLIISDIGWWGSVALLVLYLLQ